MQLPKRIYATVRKTNIARWLVRTFDLRKPVITRTPNQCIFHCCVQKTGSQWIKSVLRDRELYRYHGLKPIWYNESPPSIPEALVPPVHKGKVHIHYYIDFPTYQQMPKPERYKTFYIFRDPRDIVVSWYFSIRNTHSPRPSILPHRKILRSVNRKEGLKYAIRYLQKYGVYKAMSSWADADQQDSNILLYRFEDLVKDNLAGFSTILNHCDISVPSNILEGIIERHSFSRQTKGRSRGIENRGSHLRKGVAGDWQNHFDEGLEILFRECADDLVDRLGYDSWMYA